MAVSPLPGGQWPPGWHGRYMFSIGRFSETKNLMRVAHNSSIHPGAFLRDVPKEQPKLAVAGEIVIFKYHSHVSFWAKECFGHLGAHIPYYSPPFGVTYFKSCISWPFITHKGSQADGNPYVEYVDIWWKPLLDLMEPPQYGLYIYPFIYPPWN